MLDIVQMPLAKRLWRISKHFKIPLNDIRMQELDIFDIEFYEYSMIAEDPKKLEQLQNHFYDPEFDEFMEEFEKEMEETKTESNSESSLEDYEVSESSSDISDWERVNE